MTIGWEILEVGEQALVYNHGGEARIECGPKRLFLWREKFNRLTRFSADQNQYLVIIYKDGNVDHFQGPYAMFLNPIEHSRVEVNNCESLDANEALVVYKQTEKETNRYVLYGPTLFMPAANEWLHLFVWHGTDPKSKTRMIPGTHRFNKLKIIPDQFYYNVDEVRTSDDALIRIKLMMFYELTDVDLMLNSTTDPMADFINCLSADVVAFASKRTYMSFINQSDALNELNSYPQLLERCKAIGYSVTKVVFRGYFTHDRLQKMHDWAIERRTNLKIEFEKEGQQQDMVDLNLKNEMERMKQEQKMELEELKHQQEMEVTQNAHTLEMEKRIHGDKLQKLKKDWTAELSKKMIENQKTCDHLFQLAGLGVDLTQFLVNEQNTPGSITKVVSGDKSVVLHLHQTSLSDTIDSISGDQVYKR
ncbi:hypothetical protein SNE40_000843 [Patella caerulea]|uniref:Uncharacterized protein n=1 Tax=Patella caerulea TaxID=87958 RepID=A0AAN8KCS5_PATCE